MQWLEAVRKFVDQKPLAIVRFDGGEWERLYDSRRGLAEFTTARPHPLLRDIKPPVPCLVAGHGQATGLLREPMHLHFGLITSRTAVTTLESRIKVRRSHTSGLRGRTSQTRQREALRDGAGGATRFR